MSHQNFLTHSSGHRWVEINRICDSHNVGLFIIKRYVRLIKEDRSNYELLMIITPKKRYIYLMYNFLLVLLMRMNF